MKDRHGSNNKCPLCESEFNSKEELEEHVRKHSNSKIESNYSCDVCQFRSTKEGNLKRHIESVHPNKNKSNNYYQGHTRRYSHQEDSGGYYWSNKDSRQEDRRHYYSIDERRKNGFCRNWNNDICYYKSCKFLHEESPECRYQDRCRNISKCRFFNFP